MALSAPCCSASQMERRQRHIIALKQQSPAKSANQEIGVPDGTMLGLHKAEELPGVVREAGENGVEIPVAEMLRNNFAENGAIVGG